MIGLHDLSITPTTLLSNSFAPFGWSRSSLTSIDVFITALPPKKPIRFALTNSHANPLGYFSLLVVALSLTQRDDCAFYV